MTALIFNFLNLHMKTDKRFYILVIVLLLSFMFCVTTNAQTGVKDTIRTDIPCGKCEFLKSKSNKKKTPIAPKKRKNEALRREKLNDIK